MIESKVAKAILQDNLEVRVGTEVYKVAPPTPATLIRFSELSSRLPRPSGSLLEFAIGSAKDAKILGEIVATLILGEQPNRDEQYDVQYKKISKDALYMGYAEINSMILGILNRDHVEGFYVLTASLVEGNLLTPKTTQSGQ